MRCGIPSDDMDSQRVQRDRVALCEPFGEGKQKCKHSPTLHEESLHRAIVDAINDFCDVREKVKTVLKESVQRTISPEGKTLAQLEKLKKEMNDEVSRLLDLTLRENDYTKYDSEFKRLSDEIEKINEQICM